MSTSSEQQKQNDFLIFVEENSGRLSHKDISGRVRNYITLTNKQRIHYLETVFHKKTFS